MEIENELIVVEENTALQAFSSEGGLEPILSEARDVVRSFEHDLSTAASRKRTASLAMKVRKLKTRLDSMGKELTAEWAAKKKAVDVNRKSMRDELDDLAKEARQPLDYWEQEQERIEEEKRLKEEREALEKQIEIDHEMALLMNEKFDREKEEERKHLEEERVARENLIRKEAEEKAKLEAEAEKKRLEEERQAALFRERQAEERRNEEEKRRVEAEERAAAAAQEAAERARQDEINKQRKEVERQEEERKAREADIEHRKQRNNEVRDALVGVGLSDNDAVSVIKAIVSGKIPYTKISY